MSYNFQKYERELVESNKLNKAAVFDALTTVGITEVIVEFDGYGDSLRISGTEHYATMPKASSWQRTSLEQPLLSPLGG
jgi:hypothetical protein